MDQAIDLNNINALIFDLGGVIINLNYQKAFEAFAALGAPNPQLIGKKLKEQQLFEIHGNGDLSDSEFRTSLQKLLSINASDADLDEAFNALLANIPKERIHLLQALSKNYRLFLLSNTNLIHINKVNEILFQSTGVANLTHLFEKVYYSYHLKLSKPGVEIYRHVIKENSLVPNRTLFIDDLPENIQGAEQAGLKGVLVSPTYTILDVFKDAI